MNITQWFEGVLRGGGVVMNYLNQTFRNLEPCTRSTVLGVRL